MENKCETSFKVGDKVKCLIDGFNYEKDKVYTISHVGDLCVKTEEADYAVWMKDVELLPPTPKSMLKDFTRIVTAAGDTYIVVKDMAVDEYQCYIWLDHWDSELKGEFPELDVKQIFECEDNTELLSHEHLGTLIWQRETPEDVANKNKRFDLMTSMKTLQTELDVMKKALEEME